MLILTALACLNTTTPTVPATVAPAPVPTPPVTPDNPLLPSPFTPLANIPSIDWPAICAEIAVPRSGVTLSCSGDTINIPARTAAETEALCLHNWQMSSDVLGCDATFGDVLFWVDFAWTCDAVATLPAEFERLDTCRPGPPPPTPPPPPPPPCETLVSQDPADGAIDVDQYASFAWTLSAQDTTLLVDTNGIGGTGSWSGSTYTWTPAEPLTPDTTYSPLATWCNGTVSQLSTLTTELAGDPVGTSLIGRSWAIDLASPQAQWVQPAGVGSLIGLFISHEVLIEVESESVDALDFLLGMGIGGLQDTCIETTQSSGDFVDPVFSDLSFSVPFNGDLIGPFAASGALSPSGALGTVRAEGTIDTRPLVDLLVPGGADDEVCLLMSAFGVSCTPCPDGLPLCVDAEVENVPMLERTGGPPLVEITATDLAPCP